jgi:hypothetical protein
MTVLERNFEVLLRPFNQMAEFSPPNSFRYQWLDFHGVWAIHVVRRGDKTHDFVFTVLEQDDIALEGVRNKCVEMDVNARKNGILA